MKKNTVNRIHIPSTSIIGFMNLIMKSRAAMSPSLRPRKTIRPDRTNRRNPRTDGSVDFDPPR
jgi:hypothetical protein